MEESDDSQCDYFIPTVLFVCLVLHNVLNVIHHFWAPPVHLSTCPSEPVTGVSQTGRRSQTRNSRPGEDQTMSQTAIIRQEEQDRCPQRGQVSHSREEQQLRSTDRCSHGIGTQIGDSPRQNIWFFGCRFDRDYRPEQVLQTETPDLTAGSDPSVDPGTGSGTGPQSGPGTDGLTLGTILVLTDSGTGSGARPEAPSQWSRRTTGGHRGCETREGKDGDGGENHESARDNEDEEEERRGGTLE